MKVLVVCAKTTGPIEGASNNPTPIDMIVISINNNISDKDIKLYLLTSFFVLLSSNIYVILGTFLF